MYGLVSCSKMRDDGEKSRAQAIEYNNPRIIDAPSSCSGPAWLIAERTVGDIVGRWWGPGVKEKYVLGFVWGLGGLESLCRVWVAKDRRGTWERMFEGFARYWRPIRAREVGIITTNALW